MPGPYDDLLHLPRHVSPTRTPMARAARAAQFLPYAALRGFDAAVQESARQTDARPTLDELEKERLNGQLLLLLERVKERPEARLTYFAPDARKSGGALVTLRAHIRGFDAREGALLLTDGTAIPVDDLCALSASG